MFGLGIGELAVILFIVLLLFGGSKFPQLGGALGKDINHFKHGLNDGLDHPNKLPGPNQSENHGPNNGSQV